MAKEIKLVRGDINIVNGKVQTLQDGDKLQQQIMKLVVTKKGHRYHPEYGSQVYAVIGRYEFQENFMLPLLRNTIEEALLYYRQIQVSQESIQIMSDEEVLIRMESLNVERGTDKTAYLADCELKSRAGENLPTHILV
jgi:phage baseplate assembly protein W